MIKIMWKKTYLAEQRKAQETAQAQFMDFVNLRDRLARMQKAHAELESAQQIHKISIENWRKYFEETRNLPQGDLHDLQLALNVSHENVFNLTQQVTALRHENKLLSGRRKRKVVEEVSGE